MSQPVHWTFGVSPDHGQDLAQLISDVAREFDVRPGTVSGGTAWEVAADDWVAHFDDASDDPFAGCPYLIDLLADSVDRAYCVAVDVVAHLTRLGWTCVIDDAEFDNPARGLRGGASGALTA